MKKIKLFSSILLTFVILLAGNFNLSYSMLKENSNYKAILTNEEISNDKKNILLIKLQNFVDKLPLISNKYFYDNKKLDIVDLLKITLEVIENDDISGILFFIDDTTNLSISDVYNLIDMIKTLKKANKEVIIYSTSQRDHIFALSIYANKSFCPESSLIEINPPKKVNYLFVKDLFQKLGIDLISIHKRNYKIGHEIYSKSNSSEYLKEMVTKNLNNVKTEWIKILDDRSREIKLQTEHIAGIKPTIFFGQDLIKYSIIDGFVSIDSFLEFFQEKYNVFQVKLKNHDTLKKSNSDKIVILSMDGRVSQHYYSTPPFINYKIYIPILKELELNSDVKAVILKINSHGGDPQTSDIISHAIKNLSKKKPVIAFVENYALSGAYFISSASNLIIANPFSEVGSIGIFHIKISYKKLFEKLGLKQEMFSLAHENINIATSNEISDMELKMEDVKLENLYFLFKKKVSDNRNIDIKKMEDISQGKTYIAAEAKEINLIDEIGSIQTAFDIAKEKANLKKAEIINYPVYNLFLTSSKRSSTPQKALSSLLQSKIDIEYLKSTENKLLALLPENIQWIVSTVLNSVTDNSLTSAGSFFLFLGL